jgi:acetoin utilization deacetylase AcuC-like enzyme
MKMKNPESKTVMTFHEKFRQYDLGEGHPFRGDRFANAMRFFESQGLFRHPEIVLTEPQSAPKEDLLRIHDEGYVDLIFRLANESKPYDFELALLHVSFASTGFNLALVWWYVIVVD